MPAVTVAVEDLTPFSPEIDPVKAQAMIDDALALAAQIAPCILDVDFAYPDAARAVLRGAVLRWNDAGSGAFQSQQVGPFGATMDTRQQRRGMFWPSEITSLQNLCSQGKGSAFTVDSLPNTRTTHSDICALNFGAEYCSCGAVLTQLFPLYEV